MKLIYSIDLDQGEKFIEIFILGILMALKNNAISINEAEGFIFKPFIAELFKQNISERLSEYIVSGCELEDYQDLAPDKLDDRINALVLNLLSEINVKTDFGRLINNEIDIL